MKNNDDFVIVVETFGDDRKFSEGLLKFLWLF